MWRSQTCRSTLEAEVSSGKTTDGDSYLRLEAVNCNLEGEQPGLYFPTMLDS
jgi:hypothetical protein